MSDVKIWKEEDSSQPKFPSDFDVIKKAALQVTDIVTNRNKYYAIELHGKGNKYRVYTHYGRTDDLQTNPNAGVRECRYFSSQEDADVCYSSIYIQKTSKRKGYKEMSLASSKIGSKKAYGQSTGEIDIKTLKKLADKNTTKSTTTTVATIPLEVQEIVSYLYNEATKALISTVSASITANGIETPLGVLTIGQIDKGQIVLDQIGDLLKKRKSASGLIELSGQFYTMIPHRFGRSREAAQSAVIDTADKHNSKQDTLQLMRDMLSVNGKGNVLATSEIQKKYDALNCKIEAVDSDIYRKVKKHVEKSGAAKVKNVWSVNRQQERSIFTEHIGNKQLLFHGSAPRNWVGILSRGLLMPKIVVTLGVHRTDAGWLGNGIYFGDVPETSLNYAAEGKRGTSFISVVAVALGKVRKYKNITYGLSKPPDGFDSCHGVSGTEFSDDEFVIYDSKQQKLQYLVEVKE